MNTRTITCSNCGNKIELPDNGVNSIMWQPESWESFTTTQPVPMHVPISVYNTISMCPRCNGQGWRQGGEP